MRPDASFIIKPIIVLMLGLGLLVPAFGFFELLRSPYTGVRLWPCGPHACIKSVDGGSPADEKGIKPGDVLLAINGIDIPPMMSLYEANHLPYRAEQPLFWEVEQKLNGVLQTHGTASLTIKRDREVKNTIEVPLAPFPFGIAAVRVLPMYVVGWAFIVFSSLVVRKKQNEISIANLAIGFFGGLASLTFPAYCMRDLAYPLNAFRFLALISSVTLTVGTFSCIHMLLVFPRRKQILVSHPWLVRAVYLTATVVILLESAEVFPYAHATTYIPMVFCLAVFVIGLIYSYVVERNAVYKKQIQWVILGFIIGCSWTFMTFSFILFNESLPYEQLASIPTIAIPISLAFAISRYRLMDIDAIFDNAVIFGATLIVLEGAELLFFAAIASFYGRVESVHHAASFFAVLIIVFLYMPLRNGLKRAVERLFKRGTYVVEHELQRFTARLEQSPSPAPLEQFSAYIKERLGPSQVLIADMHAGKRSDQADPDLRAMLHSAIEEIKRSKYFTRRAISTFGYELADRHVLTSSDARIDGSLFVPFFVEGELSHIAVLLPKWNIAAYSNKDKALLDALSVNISHVLNAGEKRRLLEQERVRLAREIHDGISQEFTGIISYSEKGEAMAAENGTGAAMVDLLGRISGSARRGIQELRSIVWALNAEQQDLGYLAAYVKRSIADLLSAADVSMRVQDIPLGDDFPVPPQTAIAVYRIIQELSHNAVKHSGADTVDISFRRDGHWLELAFSDNGRGFDVAARMSDGGNGLKNIHKRTEECGGSIRFESALQTGTRVNARFPLG